MKRAHVHVIAVVLIVALPGFAQPESPAEPDPLVFRATGIEVRQSEFEAAIAALPPEYRSYASGPGRRAFAEDLLRMMLLAQEARKNHLDQDPAISRQIELLVSNTLASAQLERIRTGVSVGEDALKKIYDERASSFVEVKARHILIAFEGSPAASGAGEALGEADAKARAEAIRERLVAGEDFAELARQESHDRGSAERGGDLGRFSRGQMVPEFDEAAFQTPVGELSPVIRTQFGYHILRVDERGARPFEEVSQEIEDQLAREAVQKKLDAIQASAGVTFNEDYFVAGAPSPEPQGGGAGQR